MVNHDLTCTGYIIFIVAQTWLKYAKAWLRYEGNNPNG